MRDKGLRKVLCNLLLDRLSWLSNRNSNCGRYLGEVWRELLGADCMDRYLLCRLFHGICGGKGPGGRMEIMVKVLKIETPNNNKFHNIIIV